MCTSLHPKSTCKKFLVWAFLKVVCSSVKYFCQLNSSSFENFAAWSKFHHLLPEWHVNFPKGFKDIINPYKYLLKNGNSCLEVFCKKTLRLEPGTLLKKILWHRCFPGNFAKFSRTSFLIEHFGGCFWENANFSIKTEND